jgi:LuxR family maltose regulon positive regulatory protein
VATAVELAAHHQAYRDFVEAGPPLRDLLARLAGHLAGYEEFVTTVLAMVPPATAATVPLTPRERQVLMELPAMRTVDQMATQLCLAPSTVKTHLRGIYRKLGVATRRDAVIEARRRGYL